MSLKDTYKAFGDTLEAMDKWMHCAILMGYIAIEAGADEQIVNQLIRADKSEIDSQLLAKLKERADGDPN